MPLYNRRIALYHYNGILKIRKVVNAILLLFSLGAALWFEGLGLPNGRTIAFFIIIIAPFFLFMASLIKKEKIIFPKNLGLLFLLFFLFSFFSVITAGNIQRSFEYLIFYLAAFLFMVYVYNHRETIKKPIIYIVFIFATIFSLWSLVLYFFSEQLLGIIRLDGYQFVYSRFGSHNHLGDFLLLPLVILVYFFITNKRKFISVLSIITLLPFYFLSFSRSAYVSLILIFSIVASKIFRNDNLKSLPKFAALLFVIIISIIFFFSTVRDIRFEFLEKANIYLSENFDLQNKVFTANREQYIGQSIESIFQYPILGVGPGNFILASKKNLTEYKVSESSHNVFLDIFVENGIVAGLTFIAIILYCLRKPQLTSYYLVVVVLLFNFQADYTYRIYSFFALFFVGIGLIYREKENIKINKIVYLLSLSMLLIVLLIAASGYFLLINRPKVALFLYPLNNSAYLNLARNALKHGRITEGEFLMKTYGIVFSKDPDSLTALAGLYESRENYKQADEFYNRSYEASPYTNFRNISKVYEYKVQNEGENEAMRFINSFFAKLATKQTSAGARFRWEALLLCREIYNKQCPYDLTL